MKKPFNILSMLIMALLVSCGAKAQKPDPIYQKVLPGDVSLVPSRMTSHKVTYKKGRGTMIYDMHKTTKWGKEVYELAIYFGDESATPDLIYMDINSLGFAGRRLQMDKAGYTLDLQFDQNTMKGALNPHEGSDYEYREYNKVHPHEAFEPAVINYAITALPLKEGYTASIPTMDLNNGSEIIWANIKVEKREKVTIGSRTFDTWKVISNGIRNKTLWVTTTEAYVIKMKTKGNPGTWQVVVD
ncbi:MAG: hypothetical protein Roseis2KO_30590 [Roseivirga sp.]